MNGERIPIDNGEYEPRWVYPELHFGFGFSKFQPGDDAKMLVRDVLHDLNQVTTFVLPRLAPDGYPEQPHYSYRESRAKRIDKFLKEKVESPNIRGTTRKEDIVNVGKAAAMVLDGLAETNHPVAQAVAAMDHDFAGLIPRPEIDFVAV